MGKKRVSAETKLSIVQRLCAGTITEDEAARIAGLSASKIRKWVDKYEREGNNAFLCKKEKRQYAPELKLQAVHAYYERRESMEAISKEFDIQDAAVLRNWVMQYKAIGEAAFISEEKFVPYAPELKLEAVQTYCSGKGSQDDICQKFGIRNKVTLQNWIAQYTSEGELAFFPNRKRKRYAPDVKLQAVKAYLGGEGSLKEIGLRFGLRDNSILRRWLAQYEMEGESAFLTSREKASYTPELKEAAVLAYRNGEGSQQKICKRFGIRGVAQLRVWLAQYEAEGEDAFQLSKRRKYPPELKMQAVQAYRNKEGRLEDICQRFGIHGTPLLRQWLVQFETEGEAAFDVNRTDGGYSPELKIQAVQSYLDGEGSQLEVCRKLGIRSTSILQQWLKNYETRGTPAFSPYSPELKRQAVQAYCSGEGSLPVICKRFGIQNRNTLGRWVKKYKNSAGTQTNEPLCQEASEYPADALQGLPNAEESEYDTAHGVSNVIFLAKGESDMGSKQTTTQEEKLRIARECIQSGERFRETAEKHGVTYQQVYRWTQRFKQLGAAGLEDRRGRRKKDQVPRSETEQLKVLVKKLEYEKRMLEEEDGLLKKLAEAEGRDRYRQ